MQHWAPGDSSPDRDGTAVICFKSGREEKKINFFNVLVCTKCQGFGVEPAMDFYTYVSPQGSTK